MENQMGIILIVGSLVIVLLIGLVKSRAEFIRFAEYMEALVAWHRYLGGEN